MDYEFSHLDNGQPLAEFSMGAEVLGRWFSEELGQDKAKLEKLFRIIEQLQQHKIREYELGGSEFSIRLNTDEIEVFANQTIEVEPANLAEDIHVYDLESLCGCGLEDFYQVLLSWQQFIQH